jgi:hypothetical protein
MHSGFYGTEKPNAFSYLEFGSIDLDKGQKQVWDFRMHQQAYDWLMHARYSNDLMTYLKLGERVGSAPPGEIAAAYRAGIHHPEDFLSHFGKLCALAALDGRASRASFFELGQTLFGCIEGMAFCRKILRSLNLDFKAASLKKVRWIGVDISDFFNRFAVLLHPGYDVRTSGRVAPSDIPADVFFAKGVTLLYALRTASQLADMMDYGRICLFDYSFAMDSPQEMILGTGKPVVYLSYGDCRRALRERGKELWVRRSRSHFDARNRRLFVTAAAGEAPLLERFMELEARARAEVASRPHAGEYHAVLFAGLDSGRDDWLRLPEFLRECGARRQKSARGKDR